MIKKSISLLGMAVFAFGLSAMEKKKEVKYSCGINNYKTVLTISRASTNQTAILTWDIDKNEKIDFSIKHSYQENKEITLPKNNHLKNILYRIKDIFFDVYPKNKIQESGIKKVRETCCYINEGIKTWLPDDFLQKNISKI